MAVTATIGEMAGIMTRLLNERITVWMRYNIICGKFP